jgi:ribosome-associated protein
MTPSSPDDQIKSKSQKKREMIALQKLGETLVSLTLQQLNKIPLDDELREAILLAQTIKSHEAHRRQLQYIGKIMRTRDSTTISPILAALNKFNNRKYT